MPGPRRTVATWPVRSGEFPALAEWFLVSGVVAVLGIRAFLTATGFPRVGGGELHVAHLLWGGALMLVGTLLLLAFLDRRVEHLAVVLAGFGFGTFIDEVGKFVTADNDYFFRPAIALIYVVFVALFLVARALAGTRSLSRREALANALEEAAVTVGRPLDAEDVARINGLLAEAGTSALASDLERLIASETAGAPSVDLAEALERGSRDLYRRLVESPVFARGSIVVISALAVAALANGLLWLVGGNPSGGQTVSATGVGQAASSIVGAVLVLVGGALLPTDRRRAYRWIARGLLIWILVTQVFVFYGSQLAGIGGLAVDLVAYVAVRYAIRREDAAAWRAAAPS